MARRVRLLLGLKKGDIILTAALIIIAVAALIAFPILLGNGGSKEVVVTVDGREVLRHSLPPEGQSAQSFLFAVDGRDYEGILEFNDGRVLLQRLDQEIVPLGIHHDMGPISQTYQSIVALPVRLLVRLESVEEEDLEFDVVAH